MSAKNVDKHNRFRSITVGFRVSPEEQEELNRAVALSGLPKQEYCYRKCMERDVVVQPNPRVHKALRTQMAAIASIAQVDWNRDKVIGAEITDADAISEFYALTTDIVNFVSMDNDAFQERVFGDVPEENAPEAHSAFADDQQTIRIETTDGHRFFVSIYLNYGYLYSSGGMAYHQITPELNAWFNEHLK